MITEFTCGIFDVKLNAEQWRLEVNKHTIGIISADGLKIRLPQPATMSADELTEISVLMNNIKRQYKQLQTS